MNTLKHEERCLSPTSTYLNVAAYKFISLDRLADRRRDWFEAASEAELRGSILVSQEGINLFLAGEPGKVDRFLTHLENDPVIGKLTVKRSWTDFQPFRRLLVKIKREIIAFGVESVKPALKTSPKISPEDLKAWLDQGMPVTLLDTRNDYEVELGTFRKAIHLNLQHFRDFPKAIEELPIATKSKPMVMFCTGGIRCEKAGAYLEQQGFKNVFQLDGGILEYFNRCGDAHYEGECFVFDHRVALKPDLSPSGAKQCFACQKVLTAEDLASEKYVVGVSCPACYTSPEEQQRKLLEKRHAAIRSIARDLPGSRPYENRQPMFVERKFRGWSLIDWLCENYRQHDREEWLTLIRNGQVVTGPSVHSAVTPVVANSTISEGQILVKVQPNYIEPIVDANIKVLYEDRFLIAVDKPSRLPVHPSGRYCRNTLEFILSEVYRPEKLYLLHRLDAETSGVLIVSRRHAMARKLQPQFAEGVVRKTYLARVVGHPDKNQFSCNLSIGSTILAQGKRQVQEDGQAAQTDFEVQQRFADGTSLLKAVPLQGRTHQIRLHLASLGFPIVNDPLYGHTTVKTEPVGGAPAEFQEPVHNPESPRMCLHALAISFVHPTENKLVEIEAPLPAWSS